MMTFMPPHDILPQTLNLLSAHLLVQRHTINQHSRTCTTPQGARMEGDTF